MGLGRAQDQPGPGSDPSLILAAATTSAKSSFGSWSVSVTTCNRWFKNRAKATRPNIKESFMVVFSAALPALKVLLMDNKKPDQIIVKQGSKMCPCCFCSAPTLLPKDHLVIKRSKIASWRDKVGWNHLLGPESFKNFFLNDVKTTYVSPPDIYCNIYFACF